MLLLLLLGCSEPASLGHKIDVAAAAAQSHRVAAAAAAQSHRAPRAWLRVSRTTAFALALALALALAVAVALALALAVALVLPLALVFGVGFAFAEAFAEALPLADALALAWLQEAPLLSAACWHGWSSLSSAWSVSESRRPSASRARRS